ncbi:MAG: hypothetical protein IJP31_06050 [Lachnospiraceae bacterium]|nr:hypothetical protein [Lachnospiraceae bacterium]
MKKIVEMIILKVKPETSEEQLLLLSEQFNTALQQKIDGFISRVLTKDTQSDQWVELICWQSLEAAQVALEKIYQLNEFTQYCYALENGDMKIFYLEEKA